MKFKRCGLPLLAGSVLVLLNGYVTADHKAKCKKLKAPPARNLRVSDLLEIHEKRNALRHAKLHGPATAMLEDEYEYFYFYPGNEERGLQPVLPVPGEPKTTTIKKEDTKAPKSIKVVSSKAPKSILVPPLTDPKKKKKKSPPDPKDPKNPKDKAPDDYYDPAYLNPVPVIYCTSRPTAPPTTLAPTISPAPSGVPSRTPSVHPTISPAPSGAPSSTPSVHPTISRPPSMSPSSQPTEAPTKYFSADGCQAISNNSVHKTGLKSIATFQYELLITSATNLNAALQSVEDSLKAALVRDLMFCPNFSSPASSARNLINKGIFVVGIAHGNSLTTDRHQSRSLNVDFVDLSPADVPNLSQNCNSLKAGAGQNCNVIDGSFTLYLQEGSSSSSETEAANNALTSIRLSMEKGDVLKMNDGIKGIHFRGGSVGGQSAGGKTADPPDTSKVVSNPAQQDSGVSGTGIGVIVAACVLTLILLAVAARRRRVTKLKSVTKYEDDDISLFSKSIELYSKIPRDHSDEGTEVMSTTSSNWRRARGVHVMGEGDSVLSPYGADTGSIIDDLRETESHMLYGLNVHRCQSATCDVCTRRRGLVFVPSDSAEGVLCSPVNMNSRSYPSEDTVHL